MARDPLRDLRSRYAARLDPVPAAIDGRPVVAYLGADVPGEVLTAAGFVPFRLASRPGATRLADRYHGPGIDPVAVSLLDRLLAGEAAEAAGLVLSADNEGLVRLFLYLREIRRLEPRSTLPRFTFFDLVHLPHRTSAVYNRDRLDALVAELSAWAGRPVSDEDLRAAAAVHDRVRELIRAVNTRLRAGAEGPRLTGAEALAVIGASFVTSPPRWAALTEDLLDSADQLPVRHGTRVFLTGCAHDHPRVYQLLESLGAVVVGEDHDWGALAGESAVGTGREIHAALVRARSRQAPASAGHSATVRAAQTARMAAACHAELVVAWARPHDDAPPWDVPAQRAALESVGIPLLAVPAQPFGRERNDEVISLLEPALRDPALVGAGVSR